MTDTPAQPRSPDFRYPGSTEPGALRSRMRRPTHRSATSLLLMAAMLVQPTRAESAAQTAPALQTSSRTELSGRVESSIRAGVAFLLAQQGTDGTWGANEHHELGQTALVALALLSCGESHQSPALAKAIKYLRGAKATQTYETSLRACVFATLPEPVRGRRLAEDAGRLIGAVTGTKHSRPRGLYGYELDQPQPGDFSNSQYGVLGVWYAAEAGAIEVPNTYWQLVETGWRNGQQADGGWGYRPREGRTTYASMTVAGIATLFITNDYIHAKEARNLLVPPPDNGVAKAIEWLERNFAVDVNAGLDRPTDTGAQDELMQRALRVEVPRRGDGTQVHYMLFGYERVGEASGLTRFGEHRWFDEGADFLLDTQLPDGSWSGTLGPTIDTAYALLFLSRGRAPVAIQKMQFGEAGKGRWNNRPRDAANFIRFLRHAAERHVNWQIVDASAPLSDFREAPILYLASDRPLELTAEQRDNVRAYVNEGGLLLFVNEGEDDRFARSVTALCRDLWPSYAFRDLEPTHPVMAGNFPMKGWTDPIRGLSNGVRELAILIPAGDVSWKWQSAGGATTLNLSPYAPLANLWAYLTNKANPPFKGEATWVARGENGSAPKRELHLARLKYAGNWDPEPLAWLRLTNILHNSGDLTLKVGRVEIDPAQLKAGHALAHLTGTSSFALTAAQRSALKTYLDGGGLLLFDAAGGAGEAFVGFGALMSSMYPGTSSEPLPIDHPIYTMRSHPIRAASYRRGAPGSLPPTKLPRLRAYTVDGRIVAIESAEDITAALVGFPTGGITGYTPQSAVEITRNLLAWRANGGK